MKSRAAGYLFALASVAVAVWLRSVLDPILGPHFPLVTISVAFVLTVWLGGLGPSILSMVVGMACGSYFFLEPRHSFLATGLDGQVGLALHLVAALVVITFAESLRGAKRRAEHNADLAIGRQARLEREIVERIRVERELRESEQRFRQLAENINEVFWLFDVEAARVLYVSPAYEKVWGRTRQSLYEQPRSFLDAIFPEDRQRVASRLLDQALGHATSVQYRINGADGATRWVSDRAFPIRDASGRVTRVAGIAEDVSAQRQMLSALENERELLRALIEVQEKEKQLLCYDIHDGVVQYVAGALMLLEGHSRKVPADEQSALEKAIAGLRRAVAEARRLIRGVRPSVLDDSGIIAGIADLADQSAAAGVRVEFRHDLDGRLPKDLEIALYRIAQEALSNVAAHSGSDRARVELRRSDGRVRLEIEDWGCGFDTSKPRKGNFGVRSMSERARLLGGECSLESEPGSGTRVRVSLPLSEHEGDAD